MLCFVSNYKICLCVDENALFAVLTEINLQAYMLQAKYVYGTMSFLQSPKSEVSSL